MMKRTNRLVRSGIFAALIAVGAAFKIALPSMTITLQSFFVFLAGLALGAKGGCTASLVYVALGLCGLPVFAGGGGISYVFSPTFGYLLGFAPGAFLAGYAANKKSPGISRLFLAALLGLLVIYLFGTVYFWGISVLYLGKSLTVQGLLFACVLLPLPVDVLSALGAAFLARRLKRVC